MDFIECLPDLIYIVSTLRQFKEARLMGQTLRFPNSRIHRALLSLALSVLLVGSGLFIVNQTTRLGLSGGDTAPDVNLPDLAIYDDGITFSNDKPHDGDVIEICGNIHNIGNATALEVRTDFHDHFNGSSVKIGTTWIQEIPPSENRITCTSWTAHPAGIHGILVKVDPENRIEEFREDNNAADRAIEVLPKDTVLPDLTIDGPIHFSKDHPKEGEVIKICVTVVNIGAGAADEIPVKFTDVFHGVSTKIGVTYIGHLDPGAWAETCVEWTAKPAG